MKKIVFATVSILFSISCSFAQDTIIKNTNEKIIAKVLEINPTEIKYKRFDFQDGPTYIDKKSDIKMIIYSTGVKEKYTTVEKSNEDDYVITNHSKEDDYVITNHSKYINPDQSQITIMGNKFIYQNRTIKEPELQYLIQQTQDKKIITLINSANEERKKQYIGFLAIPLGVASYVCLVGSLFKAQTNAYGNTKLNSQFLSASGLLAVGAIACPIVSAQHKKNRMTYNKQAVVLYNQKF
jgi:hypothetical protein